MEIVCKKPVFQTLKHENSLSKSVPIREIRGGKSF